MDTVLVYAKVVATIIFLWMFAALIHNIRRIRKDIHKMSNVDVEGILSNIEAAITDEGSQVVAAVAELNATILALQSNTMLTDEQVARLQELSSKVAAIFSPAVPPVE